MKRVHLKRICLLLAAVLVFGLIPTAIAAEIPSMETETALPAEDIVSPQGSVTGTVTRSDYINGYYYFWGDEVRTYNFTYADGTAATAHIGGMGIHYVDGEIAF